MERPVCSPSLLRVPFFRARVQDKMTACARVPSTRGNVEVRSEHHQRPSLSLVDSSVLAPLQTRMTPDQAARRISYLTS